MNKEGKDLRFSGLNSTTGTRPCYKTSGPLYPHLEKENYSIGHDLITELSLGSIWIVFVEGIFKNSKKNDANIRDCYDITFHLSCLTMFRQVKVKFFQLLVIAL